MRLEGNEDFDETWAADHPCYGHNPEDIMPFHNLFLEDGTGYQVNNHGLQEQISPMNECSRIFVMLKALRLPTFPPSGTATGSSRTPIRNITTNRLEKLEAPLPRPRELPLYTSLNGFMTYPEEEGVGLYVDFIRCLSYMYLQNAPPVYTYRLAAF